MRLFIIALSEVMNELVNSDISYHDSLVCLDLCLVFSTVMTCTCNEDSYSLLLSLSLSPSSGTRYSDGDGSSNEVQRTMLELINQLDGFDPRGNIKVLMATNR